MTNGPARDGTYRAGYVVQVTNSGPVAGSYGPITDTPSFAANLPVLGASWSGQATGSATGAGPFTIGAANTTIAAGATHTYSVVIDYFYADQTPIFGCGGPGTAVHNRADLPAGQEAGPATDNTGCVTPALPPSPNLFLVKSAGPVQDLDGNGPDVGDTITYSFTVRNTGNVDLTAIALTDPKLSGSPITCPATTLPGGGSAQMTCSSASYTLTQADVDAGAVTNLASVTGVAPNGTRVSDTSGASTPIPSNPSLTLTKTAAVTDVNGNGATDLGDRIAWSFVVRNTGTVTLTSVAVSDPRAGTVTCPTTTLAPGAQTTCAAAAYTITQADVDAGVVSNTATSSGRAPGGAPVASNTSTAETPVAQVDGLALTKTAAVTDLDGNGTDLGDTIRWTFTMTNSGTTTVSSVAVNDPLAGSVSCAASSLAPGASTTCTAAAYAITQADVDAGQVVNTATASGRDPAGATVTSPSASSTTPVTQASSLSLTKSATRVDVNSDGLFNVADRIQWSFDVRNTGTTTITAVAITDPRAGTVTCPVTTLAPGAQTTCTAAPYQIVQADLEAGSVTNTATARGTGPGGATVTSAPSSVTTPLDQGPAMVLTKNATVTDVNGNGVTDRGDRITYTFTVRNIGNVTLNTLTINDPKAGAVTCAATTLALGASTTCTATNPYVITQADVDAGAVTNTAQGRARSPLNLPVVSPSQSVTTPVTQTRGMTLTKTAAVTDVNGTVFTDQGDRIAWSFVVRNTGTVTLTSVGVSDPRAGTVTCSVTTLAPGAQTTCTAAAYTVTQADVDAGVVANTAVAAGRDPQGGTVTSPSSSTNTPVNQASGVDVQKSGVLTDLDGNGPELGDLITWTITVRNPGTTTITDIAVTDIGAGPPTCPSTSLAGGASMVCTVPPYTVDVDDMDGTGATNIAEVRASSPQGPLFDSVFAFVPVDPVTSVSLAKSAAVTDVDGDGRTGVGDQVRWSFVVTNTGNTSVYGGAISDPLAGPVSCERDDLPWFQVRWLPGESFTCTADAPYTITRDDAVAGVLSNTAVANVIDAVEEPLSSAPASTDTPVTQEPGLGLVKRAAPDDGGDGRLELLDTVTYTFEVTNTGTATVTGLTIDDPMVSRLGPISCPVATLAAGASTTCTGSITVSQSDVDAGEIRNTATAGGRTPGGEPVESDPSSVVTPVDQLDAILLTKSADLDDLDGNGPDAGDEIRWAFTATNTGTTTLDEVVIEDPLAGRVSCVADRPDEAFLLDPGETRSDCFAEQPYTVTQADVDAGAVENTATASSPTRDGGSVTSNVASTLTPFPRDGALTLTKTATVVDDGDGVTDLGDVIRWTFEVTNTGVTTATGVAVDDPFAGIVTCGTTTLAPGASTACTVEELVIGQSDVDRGVVSNTAVARATAAGADVLSAPASTDTPVAQTRSLAVTKTAAPNDVNGDGAIDAEDTIDFAFEVTNTGTVTITGLAVEDPAVGTVTCPSTTLAPGTSMTCRADEPYSPSLRDMDAGVVVNVATAVGTGPGGAPIRSEPSSTETPLDQRLGLSLTKQAEVTDVDGDGAVGLGDTITWTFLVTNTGNVTLDRGVVDDPLAGPLDCITEFRFPGPVVIVPDETWTCVATTPYVITQADVDDGVVTNTATVRAFTGGGDLPVVSNPSSTETVIGSTSALTLTKTATVADDGDGAVGVGDVIRWTFEVTNAGTATVSDIVVDDPLAGAVTCGATTLAPGATTTCAADAEYPIAQADVDAGEVVNVATASGPSVGGPVTSFAATTTTQIPRRPALTLAKTGSVTDTNDNGRTDAGDEILWTFVVENTGNVTLRDVVVDDPRVADVECTGPGSTSGAVPVLDVASSLACTAMSPYVITESDVDAGEVTNTATAGGQAPDGAAVTSSPATAEVAVDQTRRLALVKRPATRDANGDGRITAGDIIAWAFTVTNEGTVTMRDIEVDDPTAGPVTCADTTLAPGESTTCRTDRERPITAAEAAAKRIRNVATASAGDSVGTIVSSAEATAEVVVSAATPPATPSGSPTPPPTSIPTPRPGDGPVGGSGPLASTGAAGLGVLVGGGTSALLLGAWLIVVARRRRQDGARS
ncbi:MAG: DUF7507 domain-containing protein [Dermatophilaceae bacterium]